MNLVDPRSSTNAPRLQSAPQPAPAQHSSAPRIPPEDRTGTSTLCQRQQANRGRGPSPRWLLKSHAIPLSPRLIALMPRMYLFNQSSASPPRRGLVPTDQTTKNQRSRILLFHMAPEKLSENQICAQPSASRGGPESDPPSRLSGRAARAWQRARSSSHHRSDWAELTV